MSVVNNEIILSNVKQNDQIFYQLLIIKGKICNISKFTELQVLLNNDLVKFHEYCVDNSTYTFIVVVRLHQIGVHNLEFRYDKSRLELNVTRVVPSSKYSVVPLYVIFKGHSGYFQSSSETLGTPQTGCKRIQLGLELIQSIYAEKLYQGGFDKKTFCIEKHCEIFYSQLDVEQAYNFDENELWTYLAREIVGSEKGDFKTKKYIAFLSFTYFTGLDKLDYTYENIFKKTKGRIAISTGGLALLGTGCLYVWADHLDELIKKLKSNQTVDVAKLLDDSNYRRTYGGCYSTTLGTLCHEIGHLFDLGHTEDGIMGNDIDFINRFFSLTNYTENLPNRIISCNQPTVKTQRPNSKLTKLRKPGTFLDAYHKQKNNDLCYFTKNCLITLNYHKWFDNRDNSITGQIEFISNERLIISHNKTPLRLIELRRTNIGMLIQFWSFLGENKYEFRIPSNVVLTGVTIFAINDIGDLVKCDI